MNSTFLKFNSSHFRSIPIKSINYRRLQILPHGMAHQEFSVDMKVINLPVQAWKRFVFWQLEPLKNLTVTWSHF